MPFTRKQTEYLYNATHRWNIKSGATRSGKTYLDFFIIPKRIKRVRGEDGLIVLLGNTRETIRRNIISPLQKKWGDDLVSDIRTSDNTCTMFGETVYCIGADKVSQVDKIRGSGIKYCYGDEVCTWSPEVFQMLKSRLDKPYSKFDGTCNPEHPEHWFKQFIDSDADIYAQHYTIYDNDFLDKTVVAELEKEYAGTIYYNRYILGQWVRAEGLIYGTFADNPARYEITKDEAKNKRIVSYNIGIDFGGNKSRHAFVFSGVTDGNELIALKSRSFSATGVDVNTLIDKFILFRDECLSDYGRIDAIYPDSAEQTIINSIRARVNQRVYNSIKNPINDRIRAETILIGSNRFYYVKDENEALVDGLKTALWDEKAKDDKRLDDGTSNIDILDAFEYSWEYNIARLTR